MWKELFLVGTLVILASSAPQRGEQQERYKAHEHGFTVSDPEKNLFFDKNELGDTNGSVS